MSSFHVQWLCLVLEQVGKPWSATRSAMFLPSSNAETSLCKARLHLKATHLKGKASMVVLRTDRRREKPDPGTTSPNQSGLSSASVLAAAPSPTLAAALSSTP